MYYQDYADLWGDPDSAYRCRFDGYPRCCGDCRERITDEYLYDINGDLFCESCMNEKFRHDADDWKNEKDLECCDCCEPLDLYLYEVNGELFCKDCMDEYFKRNVNSYIDGY